MLRRIRLDSDSGRVLKLTGTPLRTGTARLTRRDNAAGPPEIRSLPSRVLARSPKGSGGD